MNVAYINPFLSATRTVLGQMVHMDVRFGKPYLRGHCEPQNVVHAAISLSGPIAGAIVIHFPQKVALAMASGLSGSPLAHLDADCLDALGEITNMICGGAKKDLPSEGLTTLSPPTITLGAEPAVHDKSLPIIVVPCETHKGTFIVDIALKQADEAQKAVA